MLKFYTEGFEDGIIGGDGAQQNTTAATQQPASNAQNGQGEEIQGGGLLSFMPMILIWGGFIFVMYFLIFRPQRKREKKATEMRAALRVGDNILTSGGLYGKIVELGTDAHMIEFGTNRGFRIPVRKSDILGISEPKMTPPIKND
jgi:preprotein translocase subunit YajC